MSELELPPRILLVQDDDTIRLLIERALGSERILLAADGLGGVDALHTSRPDLILVDLDLPDLDGSTFVSEVRKTSLGACVPLLVMAPSGEERRLIDCFAEGADDFITRPLSVSELRVRASTLYMARRIAREAHPVTRLPMGGVVRARIVDRLERKEPFALANVDIDDFKRFNESRGFDVGDEVLRTLAELLVELADRDRDGTFVGHVSDDDFVVLLPPDAVESFAKTLHAGFDERMRPFYTRRELEEGKVELVNRRAEIEKVPLLSLSIGVLTTERPGLDDVRKIEHVADELTKMAKAQPGNSLFVERRKNSPA